MRIDPKDLKRLGYTHIVEVKHSETVAFINQCFGRSLMVAGTFLFIMLGVVSAVIFEFTMVN
jgi:hypothetical protein